MMRDMVFHSMCDSARTSSVVFIGGVLESGGSKDAACSGHHCGHLFGT
jgi:hypothetical protein